MAAPQWLIERPIAHRGLHDRTQGIIENTVSAARAAIEHGYAIECDVQLSRDGQLLVFHDDHLDRLTTSTGDFHLYDAQTLTKFTLKATTDSIPHFETFLQCLSGKVPLICEIKSRFNGSIDAVNILAHHLQRYDGPVAIKSFDPSLVIALAHAIPDRPRGFIGESAYDDSEWNFLSPQQKQDFSTLARFDDMKLDFLSWYIKDLDHSVPQMMRQHQGLPLMTWTVRTDADRNKANIFSDQIVFEGFRP